jgi:7-cyano-7-deazaguanine synthase in queuosine biosynthesis
MAPVTHHGLDRLAANDVTLASSSDWDRLADDVVAGRLGTPFEQDTEAHWEVSGPQPPDKDFGVVLAVSGGMDSASLLWQATDCSVPVERVFFNLGQPYVAHELRALDERRVEFTVHTERPRWRDHDGILVGRNTFIALRAAQLLHESGRWGEVWLGAVAGENDWRGGDKSQRWLADLNGMLARAGVDVRVVAPLHYLDKADQVALANAQGWADQLAATKSCHRGDVWACGACKTCFRKWVAFHALGLDRLLLPYHDAPITAFAQIAEQYEQWIERPGSKYGLRRRQTTRAAIASVRRAAEGGGASIPTG